MSALAPLTHEFYGYVLAGLLLMPVALAPSGLALAQDLGLSGDEREAVPFRIVREPGAAGKLPAPSTPLALTGTSTRGGQIALNAARSWLLDHGMRVVERRSAARQLVIVEYTHPLTVHVRGVDLESGDVRWVGGAHVEGEIGQLNASVVADITREALSSALGAPQEGS